MKEDFKGGLNKVMLMKKAPVDSRYHQRGGDNRQVRRTRTSVDNRPIRVWGRFGCLYSPVRGADWSDVLSVGGGPVGKDVWIGYIGDRFSQCQSPDAAPLTELRDLNTLLHIYSDCATRLYLIWTVCITVRISISVKEVTRCGGDLSECRTMDGAPFADDRSGITFTAELCMPWDAPEAVIDINSTDLVSLGSFPDKVGLFGRRKDAAVSRIMAGRDSRSVRFVVPDGRVVDRGYHDVTVVDMEEEREHIVVLNDMTRLRELWPVEVFDHMKWYQQDLEPLRKSAKKEYSQTRPMPCRFCGKVIRVDMYRHVVRLHLDLVQLWRCPIAWCTTWKGSPQDCLEHVRSGHDAPWVSKTASIEKYAPPWTVRRQLWTDSLRIEHSGISTDMLLFSEVGMPLTQHYRVYKGGLPHAVFRTDYMARLRSLLPSPGGTDTPPENVCGVTPKSVRHPHRLSQTKRLVPETVVKGPILTEQNPAEMIGETVIDCWPSLLPVSIPLSGLSPETISGARNCVSYQPSEETGQSIMNMDTSEITIVGFGRGESFDLELAKVICDVSVLPSLVSPLQEVEVSSCANAADYAAPAVPTVETVLESPGYTVPEELGCSWMPEFVPGSEVVNADEGGYLWSLQEPLPPLAVTPPIAPMVAEINPPSGPLNSCETVRTLVTKGSPASAECVVTDDAGPDLSREGPFDACDADQEPGQSPMVLDSMSGCQYRMTSYEERTNRDDLDPSYGIHLHDPRMMEYMGAPESARLLGRTPEYWLEHMGRERTIQAALQLHHDASLIMTNVQIMSQLVTSFSRTASDVMRMVYDQESFPTSAVDFVKPGRRVRRAAHYMAAMGLWRPTSAPVFPGPISASSCNSCMACDDCFPDGGK